MAELQRSAVSFRRQGSSGLIWDDNFLSGELQRFSLHKPASANGDPVQTVENESKSSINTVRRNRSINRGEPGIEPASPRVPVCGLCRVFGMANKNKSNARTGSRKRSFA